MKPTSIIEYLLIIAVLVAVITAAKPVYEQWLTDTSQQTVETLRSIQR
jgi:hypothetical protein